jgi:hypothetical protein
LEAKGDERYGRQDSGDEHATETIGAHQVYKPVRLTMLAHKNTPQSQRHQTPAWRASTIVAGITMKIKCFQGQ